MIGNLPVAAVAGIAGGGGGLVLIIMVILILRCVWRKRRNGNDEALARLDSMYEAGKPAASESTEQLGRWNKGLSEYHKPTDSSYKAYRM
ncbi:hypothetical protein F4815DRAFT_482578 [Daldinia loculata]|nr:hypothetical protein F4815DRAFT_482578 [Daldinia loculata]